MAQRDNLSPNDRVRDVIAVLTAMHDDRDLGIETALDISEETSDRSLMIGALSLCNFLIAKRAGESGVDPLATLSEAAAYHAD